MSIFAHIINGTVVELFTPPAGTPIIECFHPTLVWVDVTAVTPTPQPGWTAVNTPGAWTFAAPVVPALTPAQLAQAAIAAGLSITSTATPALDGTYACDASMQAKLSSLYSLIQRAGGAAFPGGLTSLPWPDISGTVHLFTAVTDFLNLETAIGNYVLALDLIVTTSSGSLPAAAVTIP